MKTNSADHIYALPNVFPYNEMLFDGKLKLGNFVVKTRSNDSGFRGLTLLYTSGRIEKDVALAHGYNAKKFVRSAIVGVGDLKKVRVLRVKELDSMILQFNNIKSLDELCDKESWVEPLPYGLFFKDLKKFNQPIAFTAQPGPARKIKVPVEVVAGTLADNGYKLDGDKLVYS